MARLRLAFGCLIALVCVAAGSGSGPAPAAAQAPDPSAAAGASTYRLVDTWSQVPWQLTAGRFAHAADIGAAPDGTAYILDRRQQAIHALGADGAPLRVFRMPAADDGLAWGAERIDVMRDGSLLVLSGAAGANARLISAVDRLSGEGARLERFTVDMDYNDVAVGPDSRIYLTRTQPTVPVTPPPRERPPPTKGGVDVFGARGTRQGSLDDRPLFYPTGVDVDTDGTVYVINRVPSPGGAEPPGPAPTPPPSTWDDPPPELADPVAGVVVYAPDHAYQETVPFNSVDDVAAGPAGVFVSRSVEVYALREREPLYSGPAGQIHIPFGGNAVLHLAAAPDGRLLASMAHCYFQGLLSFTDPAARPAPGRTAGALDLPELAGPVYPMRLAAAGEVAVLGGRYSRAGEAPPWTYRSGAYAELPQSIQRWSAGGGLRSQLGICGGVSSLWFTDVTNAWWTRDVALDGSPIGSPDGRSRAGSTGGVGGTLQDGGTIYSLHPQWLESRPDDSFPGWTFWPGSLADPDAQVAPHLMAVAADAGRVAVLDAGSREVLVLDRAGALVERWPVGVGAAADALPVDLAMGGGRVYLADRGRGRVLARGPAGVDLGEWPVHAGPMGIDVGPDGDVFVLGRGGWGLRYSPSGALKASWPMPDRTMSPVDLAVDDAGRVFVAYVQTRSVSQGSVPVITERLQAGIWVFEAAPAAPEVSELPPDGCLAAPDKTAAPAVIPLGETVEVRLDVGGHCPPRRTRAQVAVVFDTSRSMNVDAALDRAKDGAIDLLGRLDPDSVEAALITFDDDAALAAPLSRDLGAVAARVAALTAWGDTLMATGIDAARLELMGGRRDPAARPVIVVVTDGGYRDRATPAVEAARAAGIAVHIVVFPGQSFTTDQAVGLARLVGSEGTVLVEPDAAQLDGLAARLSGEEPEAGLFERVTIRDEVPANMRYIADSARPPALFDPATRTLTWTLGRTLAAQGVALRYRLEPLQVGTWPTNVVATADYRDARGLEGRLVFPIPRVKVWDRASLAHRIYLPIGPQQACFRSALPLDIVLVLDSSSSMAEPAAGGGTKLDAARAAAAAFVDLLNLGQDRVALVAFDAAAHRASGLTADRAALARALGGLVTASGTRIDHGLAEAAAVLGADGRSGAARAVILLSDGLQGGPIDPVRAEAARLKALGARVYTIGLGADVDRDLLRAVASEPAGYLESPAAEDLPAIYREVSERLACEVW
jgi:Mg-chelatase subunit ChlD